MPNQIVSMDKVTLEDADASRVEVSSADFEPQMLASVMKATTSLLYRSHCACGDGLSHCEQRRQTSLKQHP
jgi:hypothetical protein